MMNKPLNIFPMTRTGSLDHLVRRQFGRRTRNAYAAPLRGVTAMPSTAMVEDAPRSTLMDDVKLFASTFAAGFIFMAVYLA